MADVLDVGLAVLQGDDHGRIELVPELRTISASASAALRLLE